MEWKQFLIRLIIELINAIDRYPTRVYIVVKTIYPGGVFLMGEIYV
jgi:hypothetical protein